MFAEEALVLAKVAGERAKFFMLM